MLERRGEEWAAESRVSLRARADCLREISCQTHDPCLPRDFLALFVVIPPGQSCGDIVPLSLFRSSAEKDHHMISILTKVEAVTRAEIDAIFVDSASHRFRVSEIALFHSREGHGHLSCCLPVEDIEPSLKRTPPTPLNLFANFEHALLVTPM